MEKGQALIILNNVKERIKEAHYFRHEVNICRNLDKVRCGIKNGFDKKN